MCTFIIRACSLSILFGLALADYQIMTPPDSSDLSYIYTVGSVMDIKWNSDWTGSGPDPIYVDLFVTWYSSDSYTKVVFANTSTQSSTYRWRIDVAEEAVRTDDAFVFRFVPAHDPPNYLIAAMGGKQSPSRGFRLELDPSAMSSTSTTISDTPNSTATSTSTSLATPTPTPTVIPPASTSSTAATTDGSSVNIGAIVGGILGGLALVALGVIAFFLSKLVERRKAKAADIDNTSGAVHQPPDYSALVTPPKEDHAQELYAGQVAVEVDGRDLGEHVR